MKKFFSFLLSWHLHQRGGKTHILFSIGKLTLSKETGSGTFYVLFWNRLMAKTASDVFCMNCFFVFFVLFSNYFRQPKSNDGILEKPRTTRSMKTVWCEILHNSNNPLILSKRATIQARKKKKKKMVDRRNKKHHHNNNNKTQQQETRVDRTAPAGRTHLGPRFFSFLFLLFVVLFTNLFRCCGSSIRFNDEHRPKVFCNVFSWHNRNTHNNIEK